MSLINGTIGNRRNNMLLVRLTSDESKTLENMAASYNTDKSEIVRQKLFGRAADYVKSEISGAIEKVRNGYQNVARTAKNYFTDPEDVYSMAYAQAQPSYGINLGYR